MEIIIGCIRRDALLWKKDGDLAWAFKNLDCDNNRQVQRFVDGFLFTSEKNFGQWRVYLKEKQATFLEHWKRIEEQEVDLLMLVDQLYAEKKDIRLLVIDKSEVPKKRKITAHVILDFVAKEKYGHWSNKGDILVEVALKDLEKGLMLGHYMLCQMCGLIFNPKGGGRPNLFCSKMESLSEK